MNRFLSSQKDVSKSNYYYSAWYSVLLIRHSLRKMHKMQDMCFTKLQAFNQEKEGQYEKDKNEVITMNRN